MRQEHTMKRILGIIYHSIVLSIFLTITYYGYLYLYPGEQLNIINLLILCKYITFITMILIQGYFIASTPLQLCKQYTIHSYFYVLVFTYAGVICSLFYIVLVIDSTVVTDNKELKSMPLWFNHLCHGSINCCLSLQSISEIGHNQYWLSLYGVFVNLVTRNCIHISRLWISSISQSLETDCIN
uniref:Uncharacterized protein n=1 Tax=Schistosoma japonicum TaxID=6182 RepID=C1LNN4_SCHJA|nr:hypothetical protein [Schistosoma japonicum]